MYACAAGTPPSFPAEPAERSAWARSAGTGGPRARVGGGSAVLPGATPDLPHARRAGVNACFAAGQVLAQCEAKLMRLMDTVEGEQASVDTDLVPPAPPPAPRPPPPALVPY